MEIDTNPYSPPNDNGEVVGPFFRWRLIPAFLIGLLGILSLAVGIYCAGIVVLETFTMGFTPFVREGFVVIGFYAGPGISWIASALLLWKKRYAYAMLLVLLGCAIPVALQPVIQ